MNHRSIQLEKHDAIFDDEMHLRLRLVAGRHLFRQGGYERWRKSKTEAVVDDTEDAERVVVICRVDYNYMRVWW